MYESTGTLLGRKKEGGGVRKLELSEPGEADRGGEEEQSALLNGNGLLH